MTGAIPRRIVWLGVAGAAAVLTIGLLARADTVNSFEISPDVHRSELRRLYTQPIRQWPAPWLDADIAFVEFGALPALPAGPDEKRWAALGERLFHDPVLSADGDLSCSACHDKRFGWSIARAVANGPNGQRGRRNPPSLYNSAWNRHLAWDGRGSSLAAQSLLPLMLPDEMANPDVDAVLQRLRSDTGYTAAFATIKGTGSVLAEDLAKALASFQRSLETTTRFDRFVAGEHGILTDQEISGLHLFRTKARCANCHFGPLLTDGRFHNLKISFFGEKSQDLGRYEVTGVPEDVGRFRTPSLRHVSKTAPYMHNGLFPSLDGVINLYDRGGGEVWARNKTEAAHPLYPFAARLSPHIRPLNLSADEKAALASFLRTL